MAICCDRPLSYLIPEVVEAILFREESESWTRSSSAMSVFY